MKLIRYVPSVLVVFCLITVAALADSKQKGEVTLSDHVMVSSTQLEPGKYVVRWDGSGPGVQLKFIRDGKEVASVTGTSAVTQNRPMRVTSKPANESKSLGR